MHRRGFLTAVGAATLAGCSAGDGVGGADPTATDAPASTSGGTATTTPTPGSTATSDTTPRGPLKGVSLSPQSFDAADFTAFLEQAAVAGSALRWAGDWGELADPEGAPAVVATVARQHDLVPVVDTGVYSVSNGALFRPLTPENRDEFVEHVTAFAVEHAPAYLGLGVEVNLHYEAEPDSFESFVELFARTEAAVAESAPETTVYVTFQYEHLRGLRGGLFGGENDPEAAAWDLIDRFPGTELVGLTTYPGLIYRDPADVPDGYFDPIAGRTDVPVAITETGWTVETIADGWESDEAEQAAYVRRLFELTGGLDLELLLWLWIYEQETAESVFRGMGLRGDDGTSRPAWDAWVDGVP